jgi:hypothetical protein
LPFFFTPHNIKYNRADLYGISSFPTLMETKAGSLPLKTVVLLREASSSLPMTIPSFLWKFKNWQELTVP